MRPRGLRRREEGEAVPRRNRRRTEPDRRAKKRRAEADQKQRKRVASLKEELSEVLTPEQSQELGHGTKRDR